MALVLPSNIIECIAAQCDSLRDVYTMCLLNKQWNRAIKRSALVLHRFTDHLNGRLPPELWFTRLPRFVDPEWGRWNFQVEQAIEKPWLIPVLLIGALLFYEHVVVISAVQKLKQDEAPYSCWNVDSYVETPPVWCIKVDKDRYIFYNNDKDRVHCIGGSLSAASLSLLMNNFNFYINKIK